METNLLRLIYDYSIRGKIVDRNYIEKLIEVVVNSKSLDKYVSKLQILSEEVEVLEDGVTIASYLPDYKMILVFENAVNQMLEHYDRYQFLFDGVEKLFYRNLLISQVILHELEHANQRRIIDNEKSLESEILRLCTNKIDDDTTIKLRENGYSPEQIWTYISFKRNIKNENYKKNYNIAPEERLAQIKSYQEILEILSSIKKYVPNLIEFEQTNKLENLLRGFNYDSGFILSPTIMYLQQNGNSQFLHHFDWYDDNYSRCLEKTKSKYSLEDRLKYGLMIEESELDYLSEVLRLSNKYNC